ncbi:MFS transporter [Chloroflexota bacterium]
MLAHFSHHLLAALLTPLLPFIRDDFVLDYTQIGWIVSAFTLAYGISQLPAGWLADRLSLRTIITIGISGVALCGLLVGLSPTYVMLVIFLMLLGVMGGSYHPAASPLVSTLVVPEKQGQALGLHQIGGTASFFLTPLIAVGIAAALGWRGSFIVLAVPTMVFGIILYLVLGKRGYTGKAQKDVTNKPTAGPSEVILWRRLVPVIILGIAPQVLLFSVMSFIPLFVVDYFGRGEEAAAGFLALYHSSGLWAGLLGGYLSDRIGKVPVLLAAGIIAGPVIYLLSFVSFGWSISVVILIMGMSQYITMPVSEAYIISNTPQRRRSTILGVYYFASRGGPGVIMPIVGYIIDNFGFDTSFAVAGAALFAVTLGCSILLWRSRD